MSASCAPTWGRRRSNELVDPALGGTRRRGVSADGRESASTSDGQLSLKGMTVARGGRIVVRDVSIDIPAGQVAALLGPNGAGKSSLVLAAGGVLRLEAGSMTLDNRELAGRRPEKIRTAGVAIVPEGRRLLSELTVDENIRVATYSLPRGQAQSGRRAGPGPLPRAREATVEPRPELVGGRAADARVGPGARLPAEVRDH